MALGSRGGRIYTSQVVKVVGHTGVLITRQSKQFLSAINGQIGARLFAEVIFDIGVL